MVLCGYFCIGVNTEARNSQLIINMVALHVKKVMTRVQNSTQPYTPNSTLYNKTIVTY